MKSNKLRTKFLLVDNKRDMRSNMVKILMLGWFMPLILLSAAILIVLSFNMNKANENTVITSTDKAMDILNMRLEDIELASKNASYLPVISESYRAYLNDNDKKNLNESVTTFLKQQYKYNTNIKAAVLIFTDDPETLYYTYNNSNDGTYKDIQAFDVNAREKTLEISETLDTDTRLYNIAGRLYMIRNLMDSKFRPYAVLVLEPDSNAVMESLGSIWGYETAALTGNGELLITSDEYTDDDPDSRDALMQALNKVSDDSGHKVSEARSINRVDITKYEGCTYVKAVSNKYRYITAVVRINNDILKAEGKSYFVFALILLIFLAPLLVMVRQYEHIYREEIALRDARIMALQSQINPHFLNNTLEIINWEARLHENYKISGMIEALSTMLEATMNRRAEEYHTLREELNYVDAYIFIITQRFGEKLHINKQVDESLLEVKVPRLIIQPIVENAVEHGVGKSGSGEVNIIIRSEEKYILVEITDSGSLSKDDMARIDKILYGTVDTANEHHVSLGIRNVNSRLKMIYGEECGLTIKNGEDSKTVSTIKIINK